jgi:hypothetical protein
LMLMLIPNGSGSAAAGEHQKTVAPATIRIETEQGEADALVVPLSGKLRLTVTVMGPPVPAETYLPLRLSREWEVKADPPESEKLDDGTVRWQQKFALDPRGKVGKLSLQLEPLQVGSTTVKWDPIPVEVTTQVARPDIKEIRDVRPPEALPPLPPPVWPFWVGGGVGVMLLVGLVVGVREVRRRFKAKVPPLQPHEWALRELERIERQNFPAAGEVNRFHTLVSEVIRRYLEMRFRLPASRRTTGEFVLAVAKAEVLTEDQRHMLRDLLERCDLAKFAPFSPSLEESGLVLQLARRFVEATRPAPDNGRKPPPETPAS